MRISNVIPCETGTKPKLFYGLNVVSRYEKWLNYTPKFENSPNKINEYVNFVMTSRLIPLTKEIETYLLEWYGYND